MVEIESLLSSSIQLSPLFFWIVLSYLIFLFFSFDIKEIKNKVTGVEILFIAGAVGVVFYSLLEIIRPLLIEPLIAWYSELDKAFIILPFGPNPAFPSPPLTSISDYLALGFILFTILYFIYTTIFFIFVKTIKFCLDPNNTIFKNYNRFSLLREYNIIRIIALGIPLISGCIGFLIISLGIAVGSASNILFFGFTPRGLVHIAVSIFFILFFVIVSIILITIIYSEFKLFLPLLRKIKSIFLNFISKFIQFRDISTFNNHCITKFFQKHSKIFVILAIIFFFIIIIRSIFFPVTCADGSCIWVP